MVRINYQAKREKKDEVPLISQFGPHSGIGVKKLTVGYEGGRLIGSRQGRAETDLYISY